MTDIIGYIAAILTTVSFLPQAYQVIKTKDTKSISLAMYIIFSLGVTGWLVYGILIHNKPMIIANSTTIILAGIVLWYKLNENNHG